eukprot:72161-Amorphochlora_amoeboformis.AAC.1
MERSLRTLSIGDKWTSFRPQTLTTCDPQYAKYYSHAQSRPKAMPPRNLQQTSGDSWRYTDIKGIPGNYPGTPGPRQRKSQNVLPRSCGWGSDVGHE